MADSGGKTSPVQFFDQVRTEARKVTWPSWTETYRTAIFVFIMMLILGVFFLTIDTAFSAVMRWLLSQA